MALAEPMKKGGRYTRKEQEERRLQVHQLHFMEKKSAVEIAKILNVNRNTVNEDINFWYIQNTNKSDILDIKEKMIRQIQKMEIQRGRFLEYLDEAKNLDETIRIEKLISDQDAKLVQYYSKSIFSSHEKLGDTLLQKLTNSPY